MYSYCDVETYWVPVEHGPTLQPMAGMFLAPDGWNARTVKTPRPHWGGETLLECTDWDKAAFRLPTRHIGIEVAINVRITGHRVHVWDGRHWVRTRITWVGDCEPDSYSGGWLCIR